MTRANARERWKLPARYHGVVTPLVISLIMSAIVSAVSTVSNTGFQNLSSAWPGAWAKSWIVAFPTLVAILPVVRRLVGILVHPPGR